jgi:hypothetical protein
LSFGGRVFSVRPAQGGGRLSEDFRVLQRSLTRSLSGEVSWAYLLGRDMTRTRLPAALELSLGPEVSKLAAEYFQGAHADLWAAVGEARATSSDEDRAMELLAVLLGSVAARQQAVEFTVWPGALPDDVAQPPTPPLSAGRRQAAPGPAARPPAVALPPGGAPRRVVEPLTTRDIELLVQFRLLPGSMRPGALGYDDPRIGRAYYWFYANWRRPAGG